MYEIEKAEGIACCSTECKFYDKGGMFEQKCSAGYEYDNPYLPYCAGYIPDTKTGEELTKFLDAEVIEYQKGEFCKACGCMQYEKMMTGDKSVCESACEAYAFHDYLNKHGYKIVKQRVA